MRKIVRHSLIAVIVAGFNIVAGLNVEAQVNTGSVSGYVLDPSNKAIPDAAVTLEDTARSLTRSVQTSAAGYYEFDGLPPAEYELSVTAPSFTQMSTEPVRIEVDQRARLDLHTTLVARGEHIVVRAATPAISRDSSELGGVLDQTLVSGLPLNERDFLQLALLLPGTAPPVQGSQLSTRGSFAMHADGGREESNNFLLDGVDNNDFDTRGFVLQPSVDAIQEFKIATNSYSAEYGAASAGQVNIITRSGGNEFHGAAYDYLRNRDLDARNYFDGSDKPQFIRNQFGTAVGGPIVKNSTFFFGSYEGLQENQGLTQLGTVPTAAVRGGDLSSLGVTVTNPYTGMPFDNNRIPASMISSDAKDILALFPQPNLPGNSGNYLGNPIGTTRQNEGSARIDRRVTENSQLTLRYSYGRQNLLEPYAETNTELPGFGDYVFNRSHNALLQYEQTISPRTINSVLAGFNRAVRRILAQNYTTNVNQLWGVNYLPTVPRDFGYPGIAVNGYSNVGDAISLPIDRADNVIQLADNLTLIRGAHSLKIGGELRDLQLNGYIEEYARGQIDFTGALTGSGIGDLLLGLPGLAIQSQYTGPQTLRSKSWSGYFQDDWKVTRNLTLNLGLRYEYDSPATDPTNRMATFDFQTGQTVQVGTDGFSRSGTRPKDDVFRSAGGLRVVPDEPHRYSRRLWHLLRLGHVRGQLFAVLQSAVLHDVGLLSERRVADHADESICHVERLRAAGRAEHHQPEFRAGIRTAVELHDPARSGARGRVHDRLRRIEGDASAALAGYQPAGTGSGRGRVGGAVSRVQQHSHDRKRRQFRIPVAAVHLQPATGGRSPGAGRVYVLEID